MLLLLWILIAAKWVLPQLQKKGDQRLWQLRRYVCMAVHAAENILEPRALLLYNPESCVGEKWDQERRGLEVGQHCLNVLGNGGHSAHSDLLSFD